MRETVRVLGQHRRVIRAELATSAPVPSTRTLKRYRSEEAQDPSGSAEQDAHNERDAVWREVQARRRRFANVGLWLHPAVENLRALFTQAGPVADFAGRVGEAHRCFFFSHDVASEAGPAPWAGPAAWDPVSDVILQFMLEQTDPTDVLVMFDGRSRQARRRIEDCLADKPGAFEVWVIYKPCARSERTGGHRVSMASGTKEVAWILKPGARREAPKDPNYTGIVRVPWSALPQISLADKQHALGLGAPPLAAPAMILEHVGAQPLFWQEQKPAELLRQVMKDVGCRAVFDLTPGSGICLPCLSSTVVLCDVIFIII